MAFWLIQSGSLHGGGHDCSANIHTKALSGVPWIFQDKKVCLRWEPAHGAGLMRSILGARCWQLDYVQEHNFHVELES